MRFPALAALALAACAHAPRAMDDAADSLAAAETAFAAHSVREDMRAAFLAAFDDDGVFVRGGWIVSNDFLRGRPAPPIVLDWRPRYVEVAAAGDMGLSTGPTRIAKRGDSGTPPGHGQYVSVWRRAPGGPWKVAVDLGISHEGPLLWNAPLQARPTPGLPGGDLAGIVKAEAEFAAMAASGVRAAYAAHGSGDLRFYRSGHEPVASHALAVASPAMPAEPLRFVVERAEAARSGDFGYARGHYAAATRAATPLGWFLRVWRREAAGWRIVIDVANPAPAAQGATPS